MKKAIFFLRHWLFSLTSKVFCSLKSLIADVFYGVCYLLSSISKTMLGILLVLFLLIVLLITVLMAENHFVVLKFLQLLLPSAITLSAGLLLYRLFYNIKITKQLGRKHVAILKRSRSIFVPDLGEDELRRQRLIDLNLIEPTIYHCKKEFVTDSCNLTDLGRYYLKNILGLELYPKTFSDMFKYGYYEGDQENPVDIRVYKKIKRKFRRKHYISLEKCMDIYREECFSKIETTKEYNDIVQIYNECDIHYRKDFKKISKEIVEPWIKEVNKQYFILRLIPNR